MNRHRDDLALVTDFGDFRRDSHVRARVPASLGQVVVRPTIVLTQDCRCERQVEAAANALALQAAKLQKLLAEPLTRPLGSMQAPHGFLSDEAVTLVQSKQAATSAMTYQALSRHEGYRYSGADAETPRYGLGTDHSAESSPLTFAPAEHPLRQHAQRARHDGTRPSTPRYERTAGGPVQAFASPADHALSGHHERSPFDGKQTSTPRYERTAGGPVQAFASPAEHALSLHHERSPFDGKQTSTPRYERTAGGPVQAFASPAGFALCRHHECSRFDGAKTATSRYERPADAPAEAFARQPDGDRSHAAMSGYELETESDTVRQRVRDHAHARLASLEAAAASGKVSQRARPDRPRPDIATRAREPICAAGQRLDTRPSRQRGSTPRTSQDDYARSDAQRRSAPARESRAVSARSAADGSDLSGAEGRTVTPRSTATASARGDAPYRAATPRSDRAAHARSDSRGLTDARNALRNAYAASKVRSPSAPPRSSAKNAGIVDGWERLQGPKAGRTRTHGAWPWAAGLGACSMLLAYALTLSVVPQSELAQPAAAAATTAVRADAPMHAELNAPASPDAPSVQAYPRAKRGSHAPKLPTRATARVDCREHTADDPARARQ